MNIEDKKAQALELRRQGYNCAQSVLMVFADELGIDQANLCRLSSGLGSGVGGSGELCGVPNAMAIAQGFYMPSEASAKIKSMKRARSLMQEFTRLTKGKLRCAEIKTPDNPTPCNPLILRGIEILANFIESQEEIS